MRGAPRARTNGLGARAVRGSSRRRREAGSRPGWGEPSEGAARPPHLARVFSAAAAPVPSPGRCSWTDVAPDSPR
ncbi:hypothetical protein AV530_020018 [Patagioenas fasciata monilis]|uniref:Uncharacterized protein n=1 Tax=Patagioenas fasciata monilis TaxID=372326 RepID=A0A1V4JHQ9_PATFA|nr:hypothetical protein AV530_020018 [Patagioenas fasciata monilis]